MEKVYKKVGRPKLKVNDKILQQELQKYFNKEQSGVKTYENLKIGKTSFYKIVKEYESKI